MRELSGKVAVVTGAASGIGFALAEKLGAEGCSVVLADIAEADLADCVETLGSRGHAVTGKVTDVSNEGDVQALADTALERFGAVHILCNNAGVHGEMRPLWELTVKDWEWVLAVNVWSVIWGIRTFVPLMLEQDVECHIVNTSSTAGLYQGGSSYGVSKHAVVALSEALYSSLRAPLSKIGVSVLLPGLTQTRAGDVDQPRPRHLRDEASAASSEMQAALRAWQRLAEQGHFQRPGLVAEKVLDCIRKNRFWIVPHEGYRRVALSRVERAFDGRDPLSLDELTDLLPDR